MYLLVSHQFTRVSPAVRLTSEVVFSFSSPVCTCNRCWWLGTPWPPRSSDSAAGAAWPGGREECRVKGLVLQSGARVSSYTLQLETMLQSDATCSCQKLHATIRSYMLPSEATCYHQKLRISVSKRSLVTYISDNVLLKVFNCLLFERALE